MRADSLQTQRISLGWQKNDGATDRRYASWSYERFFFFSCNFRCRVLLELRWQMGLHTHPVCAQLELWEIDGTHPTKPSSHEGARGWQIHYFTVLCSRTPCTMHQLCGGTGQALWFGFPPCRAMTITQTLQSNNDHRNLAAQLLSPKPSLQPMQGNLPGSVNTLKLPKRSLWLPESKIASHPEERYSTAKFRRACNIPGLTPVFTWVLHLLTAVK